MRTERNKNCLYCCSWAQKKAKKKEKRFCYSKINSTNVHYQRHMCSTHECVCACVCLTDAHTRINLNLNRPIVGHCVICTVSWLAFLAALISWHQNSRKSLPFSSRRANHASSPIGGNPWTGVPVPSNWSCSKLFQISMNTWTKSVD